MSRMDATESIRNAKRKVAELADTTLSLINSTEIHTAGSYYLKALEEVGRIKILQNDVYEITKTQAPIVESADNTVEEARDFRIQAALTYLVRENEISCIVKNGTQFVVRKDVAKNELKRAVVSLKTKLAFL